jgi:NAD+ kinase
MAMPIDLVLVRLGESEGNLANNKGGQQLLTEDSLNRANCDQRLTTKGRKQAEAAGEWIRENIPHPFFRYYVSPYAKAKETAALLNLSGAKWDVHPVLRERYWGRMEMSSRGELIRRFQKELRAMKEDSFYQSPSGGESLAATYDRVKPFLDIVVLECAGKSAIVVCHGELIWMLRMWLERLTPEMFLALYGSPDRSLRIMNGDIIHYTRRNPENGESGGHLDWMRLVCPDSPQFPPGAWKEIKRRFFTNEELLAEVGEIPQLIDNC